MPTRSQQIALGVLAVILAAVLYSNWRGPQGIGAVFAPSRSYRPLKLENPTLRLDLLDAVRRQEYTGTHRNIFSATPPPPPEPPRPPVEYTPAPAQPAGPPPVQIPFRFYGFATDPRTRVRRAFFTNGEDIFIVPEGGTVMGRFRVLRIGEMAADLEEVSSGRRATIPMEQPQG